MKPFGFIGIDHVSTKLSSHNTQKMIPYSLNRVSDNTSQTNKKGVNKSLLTWCTSTYENKSNQLILGVYVHTVL